MVQMSNTDTERAIAAVVANIDGISDRVIDNIDEEFDSATAVAHASPTDLQRVDGIGQTLAQRIYRLTNTARNDPDLAVEMYARGPPRDKLRVNSEEFQRLASRVTTDSVVKSDE